LYVNESCASKPLWFDWALLCLYICSRTILLTRSSPICGM
jgi:hypothetical protein